MPQLPEGRFLIQISSSEVVIYDQEGEGEILRFEAGGPKYKMMQNQAAIERLEQLTQQQKAMAHFWAGYFHAVACLVDR
jgi:hypothetical protein